jgi:rhodanese-related sulfurtransferase
MAQILEFFEIRFRWGSGMLTAAEVVRAINDSDALMLDTREPSEYGAGHIINAKNLPLAKLGEEVDKLIKDKTKTVIVYNKSGGQSAAARQILKRAGFEKAFFLKDGIYGWQEANLPLEK